jgi:hypothetical protein
MKRMIALIAGLALLMAASVSAKPWRFGVISDTQWTKADDGRNPNTCARCYTKTLMAILDGVNGSTSQTNYGKPTEKAFSAWSPGMDTAAGSTLWR